MQIGAVVRAAVGLGHAVMDLGRHHDGTPPMKVKFAIWKLSEVGVASLSPRPPVPSAARPVVISPGVGRMLSAVAAPRLCPPCTAGEGARAGESFGRHHGAAPSHLARTTPGQVLRLIMG